MCLVCVCVQAAVGHPITVYGKGGQTRGFLDIRDTGVFLCVCLRVDGAAECEHVQDGVV